MNLQTRKLKLPCDTPLADEYIYARFWLAHMKSIYSVFQSHRCDDRALNDDVYHETCLVTRQNGPQYFVCTRSGMVHYCGASKIHPYVQDVHDNKFCCITRYAVNVVHESHDWETRDVVNYAEGGEAMDASKRDWSRQKYQRLAEIALAESKKTALADTKAKSQRHARHRKMSIKDQAAHAQLQNIGFDPLTLSASYAAETKSKLNISNLISLTASGSYLGGEPNVLDVSPRAIWCAGDSLTKSDTSNSSHSSKMAFAFFSERKKIGHARSETEDMFLADYFWETLLVHNSVNSDANSNERVRMYQESQSELAKSILSVLDLCKQHHLIPAVPHGTCISLVSAGDDDAHKGTKGEGVDSHSIRSVLNQAGLCTITSAQETCELIRRDMKAFKENRLPPEDWIGQLKFKYGVRRCAAGLRILLLVLMHSKWIKQSHLPCELIKLKLNEFVKDGYHSQIRASLLQHAIIFFTANLQFVDQLFTVLINSAISSTSKLTPHPLWLHEFAEETKNLIAPTQPGRLIGRRKKKKNPCMSVAPKPPPVAFCKHCDPYLVFKAENAPYPSVTQRMFGRNVGSQMDIGTSAQLTPVVSDFVSRLVRIKQALLGTLSKSIRSYLRLQLETAEEDGDNSDGRCLSENEDEHSTASERDENVSFAQTVNLKMLQYIQSTAQTCQGCLKLVRILTRSVWLLDRETTVANEYHLPEPTMALLTSDPNQMYSVVVLEHIFMPICVVGFVPGGDDTLTALALGRLDIAPFPTRATHIHQELYFHLKRSQASSSSSTSHASKLSTTSGTESLASASAASSSKPNKTVGANVGWKTSLVFKNVGTFETARKAAEEIMGLWYSPEPIQDVTDESLVAKQKTESKLARLISVTTVEIKGNVPGLKKTIQWRPELMHNHAALVERVSFKWKELIGAHQNVNMLYTIQ